MTIRVAAIEVSHWHALNDAAYLRHLVAMPDVELGRAVFVCAASASGLFPPLTPVQSTVNNCDGLLNPVHPIQFPCCFRALGISPRQCSFAGSGVAVGPARMGRMRYGFRF